MECVRTEVCPFGYYYTQRMTLSPLCHSNVFEGMPGRDGTYYLINENWERELTHIWEVDSEVTRIQKLVYKKYFVVTSKTNAVISLFIAILRSCIK